jgi:2-C-methyl-D-erythritol 4-phosphate cytidylyltransferase
MKTYALILAGGKGLRMGADLPKQFLPLAGKPVLMHTLEAFHQADPTTELILVLPNEHQAFWAELRTKHGFTLKHVVATGGNVRFDSVRNGLQFVLEESLVAVHDGVRPLVNPALIQKCFEAAAEKGAVIPVFELTESIRRIEGDRSYAEDRSRFRSVQTPQTFRSDILKKAYEQSYQDVFTDDASVVEAAGFEITLVEGHRENIKITTPQDLLLAEQLVKD